MSLITILCVDDVSHWRKFTSFLLRPEKNLKIICEASDGVTAIDLIRRVRPQVVLLDVRLPKLSGFEVAGHARALAPAPEIVFVSEESDLVVVANAIEIGASGYVLKCDASRELVQAIHAAVRGKTFVSAGLNRRLSTH